MQGHDANLSLAYPRSPSFALLKYRSSWARVRGEGRMRSSKAVPSKSKACVKNEENRTEQNRHRQTGKEVREREKTEACNQQSICRTGQTSGGAFRSRI